MNLSSPIALRLVAMFFACLSMTASAVSEPAIPTTTTHAACAAMLEQPAPVPSATNAAHWQSKIDEYLEADRENPPAPGGIVFVGSSSVIRWDTDAAFPDLPVINRGFGGSQIPDALHYADDIVTPYQPRLIVVYSGDNDIARGKSPEVVRDDYHALARHLLVSLPDVHVLFVSIKPSPKRWGFAPQAIEANRLIETFNAQCDRLHYLDLFPLMLNADGMPNPDLYFTDDLHLSDAGYALWQKHLAPELHRLYAEASPD
jgi:lysophospholipase L1-like esterase